MDSGIILGLLIINALLILLSLIVIWRVFVGRPNGKNDEVYPSSNLREEIFNLKKELNDCKRKNAQSYTDGYDEGRNSAFAECKEKYVSEFVGSILDFVLKHVRYEIIVRPPSEKNWKTIIVSIADYPLLGYGVIFSENSEKLTRIKSYLSYKDAYKELENVKILEKEEAEHSFQWIGKKELGDIKVKPLEKEIGEGKFYNPLRVYEHLDDYYRHFLQVKIKRKLVENFIENFEQLLNIDEKGE